MDPTLIPQLTMRNYATRTLKNGLHKLFGAGVTIVDVIIDVNDVL